MIRPWAQRSIEQANLLNPAFLTLLCIDCIQAHEGKDASYTLPFLVIPLALHGASRNLLPKKTTRSFSDWITSANNMTAKAGFASRARGLAPFIRESLQFAISHKLLDTTEAGHLVLGEIKTAKALKGDSLEIIEIRKASRLIAKWLSKSGSEETIMMLLGVRP